MFAQLRPRERQALAQGRSSVTPGAGVPAPSLMLSPLSHDALEGAFLVMPLLFSLTVPQAGVLAHGHRSGTRLSLSSDTQSGTGLKGRVPQFLIQEAAANCDKIST